MLIFTILLICWCVLNRSSDNTAHPSIPISNTGWHSMSEALKVLNNIRTLRAQARETDLETLEEML